MTRTPAQPGTQQKPDDGETPFWDTLPSAVFLVLCIVFARFWILEPFKIPSGSMEPTLFGHEDYGDRIVTGKLAYATAGQVWKVIGGATALIVLGFIAAKGWRRRRSIIWTALIAIGVIGGLGFAYSQDAIAGQPKCFDVVVFQYNSAWSGGPNKEINYIKRLIGLPGQTIVISGGDLYRRKGGKDEIIRKWQERPDVQEAVWYPISRAWSPLVHERPKDDDPCYAQIQQQIATLRFPWKGAEAGTPGAELRKDSLRLDGTARVALAYAFDVSNIYLKQGRWPFSHVGCPSAHMEPVIGGGGIPFRNPDSKTEDITAYVTNTWEGVQCPNCKQITFPVIANSPGSGSRLQPRSQFDDGSTATFFYGGYNVVGDAKLDLTLDVESAGSLQLEVGSDAHRALWKIPSDAVAASGTPGVHVVQPVGETPQLSPGKHTLSLAYVDATVIAIFDGREIARQLIDVPPPGHAADNIKSVVRLEFSGLKGALTKLDLSRDLYYLPMLRGSSMAGRDREGGGSRYIDDETGNYVQRLHDDEYLMLGDNSPSSADSRVWGHVPKDKLVGRASFVWWPPSRWRVIR